MISSMGSVSASTQIHSAQPVTQHTSQAPRKTEESKDTVQLSQTARQALSGDVDHDGDSH